MGKMSFRLLGHLGRDQRGKSASQATSGKGLVSGPAGRPQTAVARPMSTLSLCHTVLGSTWDPPLP